MNKIVIVLLLVFIVFIYSAECVEAWTLKLSCDIDYNFLSQEEMLARIKEMLETQEALFEKYGIKEAGFSWNGFRGDFYVVISLEKLSRLQLQDIKATGFLQVYSDCLNVVVESELPVIFYLGRSKIKKKLCDVIIKEVNKIDAPNKERFFVVFASPFCYDNDKFLIFMIISLKTPLSSINGIGPKFAQKLKKLEISTVRNLLWHFPFRYDDFSRVKSIKEIKIGDVITISGRVAKIQNLRSFKKKMVITEARIRDASGEVRAVWFHQPYLINSIRRGALINVSGKINFDKRGFYFSHPAYEIIGNPVLSEPARDDLVPPEFEDEEFDLSKEPETNEADYFYGISKTAHTAGLIPVYPETAGITSRAIRYIVKKIFPELKNIPDPVPSYIRSKLHLPEINSALLKIHFPDNLSDAEAAKKRFLFEDFFYLQLGLLKDRQVLEKQSAPSLVLQIKIIKKFIDSLPFKLTESQRKISWQIIKDLNKKTPMNRLLEGDVGSGKTIIALVAVLNVVKNGYQAIFMAPTEILARQHFQKSGKFLENFDISVALLTAADAKLFSGKEEIKIKKPALIEKINKGEVDFILGTHALLSENVVFKKPGLIIVDEQHRFGVSQRAKLTNACADGDSKTPCLLPHFLSMTATPIPRTLALAMYSDLDLSILEEMPLGRKNIITKIISPQERNLAYDFIRKQIKAGRQAFVICPRIEIKKPGLDEKNAKFLTKKQWQIKLLNAEAKSVKEEYEKLSQKIFPELKIAMLFGRMKSKEKENIMKKFVAKEADILVSTSVVEVGIDVSNATIMMIEGAEHFGLSQLHQFRGRVGRGEHQSYCFVFSESGGAKTMMRLKALLTAKNGFELAQKDLEIRGPGQFLGGRQSGMPDLVMEHLNNINLITISKEEAKNILEKDPDLKFYPLLKENLKAFQRKIHLE